MWNSSSAREELTLMTVTIPSTLQRERSSQINGSLTKLWNTTLTARANLIYVQTSFALLKKEKCKYVCELFAHCFCCHVTPLFPRPLRVLSFPISLFILVNLTNCPTKPLPSTFVTAENVPLTFHVNFLLLVESLNLHYLIFSISLNCYCVCKLFTHCFCCHVPPA